MTDPSIILVCIFIPMIVALVRNHKQKGAIICLNVLLAVLAVESATMGTILMATMIGWLAAGWVVAFVWACTNNINKSYGRAFRLPGQPERRDYMITRMSRPV